MHDAAHGGPAIPDHRVSHQRQRLAQQRLSRGRHRVAQDIGVPGRGPDRDLPIGHADEGQLAEPVDVDQMSRRGQPHIQQRHKGLAAREHLAVWPDRGEDLDRLGHGLGPRVAER